MPSLRVSKIEEGTVIDHVPAGEGRRLLRLLDVPDDSTISLLVNVDSATLGTKDILKIEGKEIGPDEMTAAAIFAPSATVNVIRDHDVVRKEDVTLPGTVTGVVDCPNPACVTNTGEPVEPRFDVVAEDPVELECAYCEDRFDHDDLDLPRF